MEDPRYDFIVFGATGYTGKYVAEEIYRIQTSDRRELKWAAAGRSEAKVKKALQDLGIEGVDVIVADVNDEDSIQAMCAKTKVLLDVVGPFVEYGEVVIKSCIKEKCDYCDITGETYFVELMISKYAEQAKEAGIYIVNFCGFDCIPNDIGAIVLNKAFNGELAYIESYVKVKAFGVNTGTWESLLRSIKLMKKLQQLRKSKPHTKLPNVGIPKRGSVFYSDIGQSWCVPFQGADRACMMRSAEYRNETDSTPMIRTNVYFCVGSLMRVIAMALLFMVITPLCYTNWGFNLLTKYPSFFTFGLFRKGGPSREAVKKGSYITILEGAGYTVDNIEKKKVDAKLRVTVKGSEPGYIATSAYIVQSAFCLLDERDKLPKDGGIYTPAAAFANTNIVQNLEATETIEFKIE